DPRVERDHLAFSGRCRLIAAREIPRALTPRERRVDRDLAHEVSADQTRQRPRAFLDLRDVVTPRIHDAVLRAVIAEMPRERARVDALDADDPVRLEIGIEPNSS